MQTAELVHSRDDLDVARTLVRWLDDRSLDPILGLVAPGAGDLASAGIGLYVVLIGMRRKIGPAVIARMLWNLAMDAALGSVPLAGDVFDFVWKANKKNLRLIETRQGEPARLSDWLLVLGAGTVFLAALAAPVAIVALVVRRFF